MKYSFTWHFKKMLEAKSPLILTHLIDKSPVLRVEVL